ncbi:XK-related protein 5 isoform X1 [Alligator mississippiensis]|uniref:XK-related protein 5 isoform X1 n=1 Tax=Alligator mississippiensis TaxID=8496 RepID=UPI002877716E|nr:XK-related protein 5 isoform X1 [Alligator mississippiensis]
MLLRSGDAACPAAGDLETLFNEDIGKRKTALGLTIGALHLYWLPTRHQATDRYLLSLTIQGSVHLTAHSSSPYFLSLLARMLWETVSKALLKSRYWDVLWTAGKAGRSSAAGDHLLQQGDTAVLRILEALVQSLPHLVLQTYVCAAVEPAGLIPGISAGLSLLSLSWALVSYSRFACLMKPGHLYMPAAALLCQLLWRMGMLGTRVIALALFARVYPIWVFAVAGAHWLVMSFWLVAQQTDIITSPSRWRLFNCLVGATYIFCYINFRDGPSRYRVAVFYVIMLVENILLLLVAADLQGALWSSLCQAGVVLSGFVIGCAALVIYYGLLHPKSTEIWQRALKTSCSIMAAQGNGPEGSSLPSRNQAGGRFGFPGLEDVDSSTVVPAWSVPGVQGDSSLGEPRGQTALENNWANHHHWLLVKLALKTGDVSKINAAFGDGGTGEVYPVGGVVSQYPNAKAGRWPVTPKPRVEEDKQPVAENGAGEGLSRREETSYMTLASRKPGSLICVRTAQEAAPSGLVASRGKHDVQSSQERDSSDPHLGESSARGDPDLLPPSHLPAGAAQAHDGSTVYFSADTGSIAPASMGRHACSDSAKGLTELDRGGKPVLANLAGEREDFPVLVANISPILATGPHSHLQSPSSLCFASPCSTSRPPEETSEHEGALGAPCPYWDTLSVGIWVAMAKRKLRPAEEPCFTSTPKSHPAGQDCRRRETMEGMKLAAALE